MLYAVTMVGLAFFLHNGRRWRWGTETDIHACLQPHMKFLYDLDNGMMVWDTVQGKVGYEGQKKGGLGDAGGKLRAKL